MRGGVLPHHAKKIFLQLKSNFSEQNKYFFLFYFFIKQKKYLCRE
jgi:hypothetical protein